MVRFCSPIYPLTLIIFATLLLSGFAIRWHSREHLDHANHYLKSTWLLMGFVVIAIASTGVFVAYSFFHVLSC